MTSTPSSHATSQYAATTANLTARISLHQNHSTNPQDWFAWLGQRLPLDGAICEVGAGTGLLWHRVGHTGRDLTLVDFSAAMCDTLRALPGARVHQADACHLPFPDASFDSLIANHMLYHVDDPAAAVREFARVLRPDGRIAVALNGRDHLRELDEIGPAIGRPDVGLSAGQNDVFAETGPGYLSACFTDVTTERFPGSLDIPDAEPVLAYLDSMADEPLTPPQREAARTLVQARIDAEGGFRVRKHTVLITARRGG
jgi:SAM-dependent methyltransferase